MVLVLKAASGCSALGSGVAGIVTVVMLTFEQTGEPVNWSTCHTDGIVQRKHIAEIPHTSADSVPGRGGGKHLE